MIPVNVSTIGIDIVITRNLKNSLRNLMLSKGLIFATLGIVISGTIMFLIFASAEEELVPSWIKNTAEFWVNDQVSDNEFINALQFLIANGIIQVHSEDSNIEELKAENEQLKTEIASLRFQLASKSLSDESAKYNFKESQMCVGTAGCFQDQVSSIIDGDTIYTDTLKIRLSLINTPEKGEDGFAEASEFTRSVCPVGSVILVDQDDLQKVDSYGRVLAKVFCGGKVLNSELLFSGHANILTQYCSTSEFAGEAWAKKFGC